MKTRNIYSLLYVTFVAVALVACNDYDAAQTAYEEIVDSDVTTTHSKYRFGMGITANS